MMKKQLNMVRTAVAAACVALAGSALADKDDVDYTSSTTITPGIWNTNFEASLAYAKANHIPVIMYYGVYGCTYAKMGAQALSEQTLKNWFAEKKIVMIYKRVNSRLVSKIANASSAAASPDPDLWLGREWVKNGSGVSAYPIMRVYWLKANGTVVSKTFSARNRQMPVTTPAGSGVTAIAGQLLGTLNMYFGSYVPGEYAPADDDVDDDEDDPPEVDPSPAPDDSDEDEEDEEQEDEPELTVFGTKPLKYQACLFNEDFEFAGILSVTAAKASSRGVVKISGKVTNLLGKSYAISGQTTVDEHSLVKKVSGLGNVAIEFSDEDIAGTVGDCEIDMRGEIGGTLGSVEATFIMEDDLPDEYGKYCILHEALPTLEPITASSKKLTAGKAGTVKWSSKEEDFVISETNPSALKLTYTPSTGMFKGSFKVYMYLPKTNARGETTGMQLKTVNASVAGFVVDGSGIGLATVKGIGSFGVTID